jgi:hypothetical protein
MALPAPRVVHHLDQGQGLIGVGAEGVHQGAAISYLAVNSDAAGVSGPGESGVPTTSAIEGLGWLFSSSRILAMRALAPLMTFMPEASGEPGSSLGVCH